MSKLQSILVTISLAGLFLFVIIGYLKSRNLKSFLVGLSVLFFVFLFLNRYFHFPRWVEFRDSYEVGLVILLYLCMLLGMVAQYFYYQISDKTKKVRFKFYPFLKPLLASPIVFMPLLATLQMAKLEIGLSTPAGVIVFFLAFQNGFFWKTFFDHQEEKSDKKGLF